MLTGEAKLRGELEAEAERVWSFVHAMRVTLRRLLWFIVVVEAENNGAGWRLRRMMVVHT